LPKNSAKLKAGLVAIAALLALALLPTGAGANCGGGGVTPAEVDVCTPTAKARLLPNGMLIPPKSAPTRVKAVISAANKIRTKPYIWGGGHARWWDRGYDCSGSVSYALTGAGLLDASMPSGSFMRWEEPGKGRWITTYANEGHIYAVIAGLRLDTSDTDGDGPGWSTVMRSSRGYVARHPAGF
jgi:hypothetical protein